MIFYVNKLLQFLLFRCKVLLFILYVYMFVEYFNATQFYLYHSVIVLKYLYMYVRDLP